LPRIIYYIKIKDLSITFSLYFKGFKKYIDGGKMFICYLISCSNFSKYSVLKNSVMVISNPSQSFFMVAIPGFLL